MDIAAAVAVIPDLDTSSGTLHGVVAPWLAQLGNDCRTRLMRKLGAASTANW